MRKGDNGEQKARDLQAVGMWKDREDMKDPTAWVRKQREGRQKGEKNEHVVHE